MSERHKNVLHSEGGWKGGRQQAAESSHECRMVLCVLLLVLLVLLGSVLSGCHHPQLPTLGLMVLADCYTTLQWGSEYLTLIKIFLFDFVHVFNDDLT